VRRATLMSLVNFAAFQAGWFSCVLGAAHGLPWIGPIVVAAIVLLHLALAGAPMLEVRLLGYALMLGLLFESLLATTGSVHYASGNLVRGMAPPWILAMWVLFATTLNVSLAWLKDNLLLASGLGALLGPLSYLAGAQLGGVELVHRAAAPAFLAVGWALMMPLLLWLARRFDGMHPGSRTVVVSARLGERSR